MKTVKQPKWDKQDEGPTILVSPDGSNKDASITEPLKVGHRAAGTIGGVEITVRLLNLRSSTIAEAEIIRIRDEQDDREILGDLSIGDTVLIKREDMRWLDIDIAEVP